MDYEELLASWRELTQQIADEKVKLESAKARVKARFGARPDEVLRIEELIRKLGQRAQRIQGEMGEEKKRAHEERMASVTAEYEKMRAKRIGGRTIEFYFVRVCQRRLYQSEFEVFMEEAKELMATEEAREAALSEQQTQAETAF